jgi:hypothetical protein
MIFLYYSTVPTEISKIFRAGAIITCFFLLQVASQVLQGKELWVNGDDRLNQFF